MTQLQPSSTRRLAPCFIAALLATPLLWMAACSGDDGDDGAQGPPGPPGPPGTGATNTKLEQGDDLPGVNITITDVRGGTGTGGNFLPGDTITFDFIATKDNGAEWDVTEFARARSLVSGPTFNYQRVIAQVSDVGTASVVNPAGGYTYTFATPIPATYLAPYGDEPGTDPGELTGQPLLNGTYTLALVLAWDYTVEGESYRDADNELVDFVLGNSGTVESREVVAQENCNRCHEDIQAHGQQRHAIPLCLMCHTAGSYDDEGVSVEFKVMVHKIHAGKNLPSVNGVATNIDGSRNYGATPVPYEIAGNDYSGVGFPAWPHGLIATPRDFGYTALSTSQKAQEDAIRTGPSNCIVCHGDPDGDGPLGAPAQGDMYKQQPTRRACGACHDDIDWTRPYTANQQTMPAQTNDSTCLLCHEESGGPLATEDAHLHPMLNPTIDSGTNINISSLVEAGTNNGDGTIDAGEKVQLTFTFRDDAGVDINPADAAVNNFSLVISGPTSNYTVVLYASLPKAALTGAQPFVKNVPMPVFLERLGTATGALGDVFTTDFTPHWNVSGGTTSVLVRTATAGGNSTLSAPTAVQQNYIDVASATSFARDDYVVIDDTTGNEEYARIQYVDGTRLWFSSPYSSNASTSTYPPGLQLAHGAGATVKEVTLATKTVTTDYTLNANNGTITEVTEFGAGNVVLSSYLTDFVMPAVYSGALNDSPDIDEVQGDWAGKPIVDGTYSLGLWTYRSIALNLYGESNSYRSTSEANLVDFKVGSASSIEPYGLISDGLNCYNCHVDVAFHGAGRRNFDSCLICHGTAGAEDRAKYIAANAPATTAASVNFRQMIHKIHLGKELANASTYELVGHSTTAYPNNYSVASYEEVGFPAFPGGVRNCFKCHGASNEAWEQPSDRTHPTAQGEPVKNWAFLCGSCHDSNDAAAHFDVQTTGGGVESCGVCHGEGREWNPEKVHKTY